mmetsp:Transcript_2726/g.5692  ORF Transcript_2726/g.5692 Transcript_2726/m.5692 type:complete len:395 (+) Transcript_2726:91-1275(+)
MPKKVFLKPRVKGRIQCSNEGRNHLLVKNATRVICQAAKKVKAFEAQQLFRNLKQRRLRIIERSQENVTVTKDAVEKMESKAASDISRVRTLDIKKYILPRALNKLGLVPLPDLVVDSGDIEEESKPTASGDGDFEIDVGMEALMERILNHAAMRGAIESMDDQVTHRRREKLAEAEGKPRPKKKAKQISCTTTGEKQSSEPSVFGGSKVQSVDHRAARTVFLSSLSGDQDFDEVLSGDSDNEDESSAQPKNRPGQRARQAKQKFKEAKKAAKHQRQERQQPVKQNVPDLSHLPPSQRSVVPRQPNGSRPSSVISAPVQSKPTPVPKSGSGSNPHGQANKRIFEGSDERVQKRAAKTKPLENHPSWEAAQVRKEKQAALMSVPGCGKKTIFTDE